MKWTVLMSLFVLHSALGGLDMITYNETAEQLITRNKAANVTKQSLFSKSMRPEGPQANATAVATEAQVEKSKALPRILYVTNRTADFMKRSRTLESRIAPSGFLVSSQGNKHQGGLRQTHDRRSAAKPSFETSRGKNWCAYVHTRLFPTAVIDSVASYLPIRTDPCYWSKDGCAERYQAISRPTYRIKHKIVTSLEWKCCPGYLGPDCEPSTKTSQLFQADEAEGRTLGGSAKQSAPAGRQQVTAPSVINQEMADFKEQTEKILTLQKQMTNVMENMDSMRMSVSSLQGRLGIKESDYVQSTVNAVKSEAVQEIIRDIVQEQIKQSQNTMKETISGIFKTMSALSVDLEATKESLQQINGTVAQLLSSHKTLKKNNKQMQNDIQSLKNEISSVQENAVFHANKTTQLFHKYSSLERKLDLEQQKAIQLFKSINHSLSQVKGIESDNLEGVLPNRSVVPEEHETIMLSRHMSSLGDTVRSQALTIMELQQKLHTQDMRIGNLSSVVGRQRRLADTTFQTLAAQCRKEVLTELEQIQGHIDKINQTLCDRAGPMELTMNAVEERISHMSYDLEELKPLVNGQPFSDVTGNNTKEISSIKSRVEDLAVAIKVLNRSVTNVEKIQDKLTNQTQEKEEKLEERFAGCQDGIEDALNDTMTVINKAIDSVKDDYYILRTNFEYTNEKVRKISDDFGEKLKSLTNLKLEIDFLNSTILSLQSTMEASGVVSNVSDMHFFTVPMDHESKPQNFTHLSQKLEDALTQLEYHQRAISRLQQANSSSDWGQHRLRLGNLEDRLNVPNANTTSALRSKKTKPLMETGLAWKYKDLDKRLQQLATQTFNLTREVLWQRGSASHAQQTCQNVSASLDQMKASIFQIFQEPINLTLFHQDLDQILEPESQALNKSSLPSSPSDYLISILNHLLKDVFRLQKHALNLDKTLDSMFSQNSTPVAGRSQRNTDSIINQVDPTSCSSGRCQNGGTCIDLRPGYVCACRFPFSGTDCTVRLVNAEASAPDFLQGSYRYAPMVTFFVAHTFAMSAPGVIRFNHLYVNYGASYSPGSGKFGVPYLGVYVFKYTVETSSPDLSGYLVVDEEDKLSFRAQDSNSRRASTRVITGDAVLELNFGQRVWLRLETGDILGRYPPVTTFGGYLLYRT
ncbi:multimerin-1-like isoform X2 [Scleropages formosus]|uniref:multimerin-1-like isoform X2 n=1 Tax=Scleropages formosus TaxID=113540 RepID=UPI000878C0BA|nr:multimerin-1 isoform X2 [Scleropages formosus]